MASSVKTNPSAPSVTPAYLEGHIRGHPFLHGSGHSFEPCEHSCGHTGCRETKRQAESIFRLCETAIGFDRPYAQDPQRNVAGPTRIVHARCLVDHRRANPNRKPATPDTRQSG